MLNDGLSFPYVRVANAVLRKMDHAAAGKKQDRGTARSRVVSNPATERSPKLLNFSKWTG